ncbi:hypothetical protein LWI29_019198 [Acer saccharum]|uniref:Transposase MuDR plant domain-containing protein n=1 Tax=Acer saccharum TaxID=4024 RepID=A0AA39SM48_ACESA|nr:hypothetical protein LWI29_019198 [Acer saccharum]
MFNGTSTFIGNHFEMGRFSRDYMSLKDLWDCAMQKVLGMEVLVGDKFTQEVPIPWSDEVREIREDAGLMDVLSEFEQRNVKRIHFNEVVDISSEADKDKERDQPNRGIAFKLGGDGRIKLEVGQLFKDSSHFKEIILDYSIQEGFKLKRIMNERSRITSGCEVKGCPWRVHGSPTYDRVTYMLKTFTDNHNCLAVPKNRDVTSVWLGKIFETFIKENPYTNIKVLGAIILRQCEVIVPNHTLYRAKKYALKIREEDHKQSYNKLYRYGHIILERNPGSCVKLSTIRFKIDYLRELYWPAARSSNKTAFLKVMDDIKKTSTNAHEYLTRISLENWAVHA